MIRAIVAFLLWYFIVWYAGSDIFLRSAENAYYLVVGLCIAGFAYFSGEDW